MNSRFSIYLLLTIIMLCLAFNFPGELGALSLVSFVPIFIYFEANSTEKFSYIKIFFIFFTFGFLYSLLSTLWFPAIYPLTWMGIEDGFYSMVVVFGLWVFLAIFMALPVSFFGFALKKVFVKVNIHSILTISFVWIILEFSRSLLISFALYSDEVLFGPHHTYYSLAYLLPDIPLFKTVLPLGGIYLGSFFILLINFWIFLLFTKKAEEKSFNYLEINKIKNFG